MLTVNGGSYCDIECCTKYAYKKGKKATKAKHVKQKKELKDNDKPFRLKCAQSAFNAFIRKRDESLGCISCNKDNNWHGQWHAGHYKTTKSRPDIRFNEDNCHKQCSVCNNHLSGNIGEYTPRLIGRIGQDKYLVLTLNKVKRYTCAELKEIERLYKRKLKELAQGVRA